jgi:hypothetical protein
MKTAAFVIAITFLVSAAQAEMREFKKHDANSAEVIITTDEKDYTQAAVYLDGQENAKLLSMVLADPASELSKLKLEIELDNCEANSTPDDDWVPQCGQVEFSELVKTSFGRGGWAEGQAGYSFFIGFRMQGTGRFLESLYLVTIVETVVAAQDENYNYQGTITKTLNVGTIQKLPLPTN